MFIHYVLMHSTWIWCAGFSYLFDIVVKIVTVD